MRKSEWPAPQNKPDWTDVICLMKAIESLHSVVVTLCVTPGAYDGPAAFTTLAAYHVPEEASVLGQAILAMSGEFPCPEHKDLCTCVFSGLYRLDELLSRKLWQQSNLPFTREEPSA